MDERGLTLIELLVGNAERYAGCPDANHHVAPSVAVTITGGGASYAVTSTSATGTTFTIQRGGLRLRAHLRPAGLRRLQVGRKLVVGSPTLVHPVDAPPRLRLAAADML